MSLQKESNHITQPNYQSCYGGWYREFRLTISSLLCGKEKESLGHLSFNYEYTRKVLSAEDGLNSEIWREHDVTGPEINQIMQGDVIEAIQKQPTSEGGISDFHWAVLGSLTWHNWSKKNKRLRQHSL